MRPVRTTEDLIAAFTAEQAEADAVRGYDEIVTMLKTPGWGRFQAWLSAKRDTAFQQLRGVVGPQHMIAESFLRWQVIDSVFEDIQEFINTTVTQGQDILQRRNTSLEEEFIREQMHGRSYTDPTTNTGTGEPNPDGGSTDPASGANDSY